MLKLEKKNYKVLDLCAGTGCIGLAIKRHVPFCDVTLVDINQKAIDNIKTNATNLNLKVKTICADYLKFIKQDSAIFDVVVCNPPYLGVDELHQNLIRYEHKIAFNNSKNEMEFYHNILTNRNLITKEGGKIIFEFGYSQKVMITNLLKQLKLLDQSFFLRDLSGTYRCVVISV